MAAIKPEFVIIAVPQTANAQVLSEMLGEEGDIPILAQTPVQVHPSTPARGRRSPISDPRDWWLRSAMLTSCADINVRLAAGDGAIVVLV